MNPKEEAKKEEIDPKEKENARKKAKQEKKLAKEAKINEKKAKKEEEIKPQKPQSQKKESKQKETEYYKSNAKLIRPNKGNPINVDSNRKNILITSALPYVNNLPHLGTLIGCVLSADVFARFNRLCGNNTLYVCGTDEYGTATETKALEEKLTPREVCDKYHKLHAEVYEWFDIDFDYFGRTSTEAHTVITQEIFSQLKTHDYIQKQEVEQYKCKNCNLTLSDRFIVGTCYHGECKYPEARGDQCDKCGKLCNALELKDPKCKLCIQTPEKVKSFHYFLQLPNIESTLKEWITKTSEDGDWSSNSKSITSSFVNEGLKPRCITRDLKWGVQVPTDEEDMKNKVFYVWFDAPIGYLSITANFLGEQWKQWWKDPEHVKLYQFMGKDNVTFHTVIFPSTMIGTGDNYTLLHHLSTTEYLNYEGTKFSKSKGVGVFGNNAAQTNIPSESWRYYLLALRPETSDTDFKWDDFYAKCNNELLANLGNLVNRVLALTHKNFNGKTPRFSSSKFESEQSIQFLKNVTNLFRDYLKFQQNTQMKEAIKTFMEISSIGNGFLQLAAPWTLMKNNTPEYDLEKAETIMWVLCNFVRFLGAIAEPFMPSFSAKLYEILNIKYDEKEATILKSIISFIETNKETDFMFIIKLAFIPEGYPINSPLPLFQPIHENELNEFKIRFSGSQSNDNKVSK